MAPAIPTRTVERQEAYAQVRGGQAGFSGTILLSEAVVLICPLIWLAGLILLCLSFFLHSQSVGL